MHGAARLWAGDPLAFPGCGGNPAVKAKREFQRYMRTAFGNPQEKPCVIARRVFCADTGDNLNTGRAQDPEAAPGNTRIVVGQRGNNARDARRHQRLGTWRGRAMMRAGF